MDISTYNPWWNEGGLWQDSDLIRVKKSPLRYHPRPFTAQDCKTNGVFTLRGPRRVGKTISLKLLVVELIEQHGWNARTILWLNFDTVRTLQQMEDLLLKAVKEFPPRLIIIDEATTVVGWQRVIKSLRDQGILESICLILTGSSAYDLKSGSERMAGRRGQQIENPDRVLLPMSYADFIQQTNLAADRASADLFLKVGGFPFRIESFILKKKQKSEWKELEEFQVFDDILFYEIGRRRLDRSIALEVIGRLATLGASCLSYQSFAKPLSITKDTARKYLEALGDAFLLATISTYDTARNRVAPRKDKKFLWIDPALGSLSLWLRQAESLPLDVRAESAVGAALLHQFEIRIWEGLSAPRTVFTWKSSSGNEIDYLIVDRSLKVRFPIEVKYQSSISDWDFQTIERAFGKGWLITPSTERNRTKSDAMTLSQFFSRISKTKIEDL